MTAGDHRSDQSCACCCGRYRTVDGERRWQPGAFDRLTAEGLARIEWHDGTPPGSGYAWQPWFLGRSENDPTSGGLAGGADAGVACSGLRISIQPRQTPAPWRR